MQSFQHRLFPLFSVSRKEHTFSLIHKSYLCNINPAYKSPSALVFQRSRTHKKPVFPKHPQNICFSTRFPISRQPNNTNASLCPWQPTKSHLRTIKYSHVRKSPSLGKIIAKKKRKCIVLIVERRKPSRQTPQDVGSETQATRCSLYNMALLVSLETLCVHFYLFFDNCIG